MSSFTMAESADSRRMGLIERLSHRSESIDLGTLAQELQCDTRTIRRDVDYLQQLLSEISGLELRNGKVQVSRNSYSQGYFANQLERHTAAKRAIAKQIVATLSDDMAIALTAGSTPYAVACEIRRAVVDGDPPHNLIVFTNSVPSLLQLIAVGVSAGVLGEIYSPEDCAFHTSEFRSAFQPALAIVGASGVLFGTGSGQLDLFSHRAEEASFLKQVLQNVPEVIVAVDGSKLGKRHPWNFGGDTLNGKRVRVVTDALSAEQLIQVRRLKASLEEFKTELTVETVAVGAQQAITNS